MAFHYLQNCVGWDPDDVYTDGGLSDMIDGIRLIGRRTFLRHADRADVLQLEKSLGYAAHPSQGLTMAADWHVAYFRSVLHGETVYGFAWSGIEHVFAEGSK